jgi:hypothetical protein
MSAAALKAGGPAGNRAADRDRRSRQFPTRREPTDCLISERPTDA